MVTLANILDATQTVGPESAPEILEGSAATAITEVRLIEHLGEVDDAGPGALIVLDRELSSLAESYRFDITVRRASSRGVAGIAVFLPAKSRLSVTALALAGKVSLAIVRLDPSSDVSMLVQAMAREAADELLLSIGRVRRACDAIGKVDPQQHTVEDIVHLASLILGRQVTLSLAEERSRPGAIAVPAVSTDLDGSWLLSDQIDGGDADALLEMVLWRLAAQVSRCSMEHGRSARAQRLSAAEILLQLIEADRATRAGLTSAAKRVGIDIDGWHAVVRLEFDNLAELFDDEGSAYDERDRLAAVALDEVQRRTTSCHVAHEPSMIVVLWTTDRPPTPESGLTLQRSMTEIIDVLVSTLPGLRFFCGLGTLRSSLTGLSTSATEARLAASSARSQRRVNQLTSFDALGLRPMLMEWYGSPSVRESVDALLAPFADVPEAKRTALLDTLGTYLDLNGSVSATAEAMHLHRNAVRYRIQRAFGVLDLDRDDPDQRLFLHLALRARRGS